MPIASTGFVSVNALTRSTPARDERLHLRGVILLGLVGVHGAQIAVGVSARSDAAADHDGRRGLSRPELEQELHRAAIDVAEAHGVVTEQRSPVGARSPGQGLQHEAAPVLVADPQVVAEVLTHDQLRLGIVGAARSWRIRGAPGHG